MSCSALETMFTLSDNTLRRRTLARKSSAMNLPRRMINHPQSCPPRHECFFKNACPPRHECILSPAPEMPLRKTTKRPIRTQISWDCHPTHCPSPTQSHARVEKIFRPNLGRDSSFTDAGQTPETSSYLWMLEEEPTCFPTVR